MYDLNVLKTEKVINKVKKLLTFVFAFFLIFSIITCSFANAKITYDAATEKYTVTGKGDFLVGNNTSIVFGGAAMKLVYFTYGGLLNSLNTGNFFKTENMSDQPWELFWDAYDSIASVGMALAALWMLIDLLEHVSSGQYNVETFVKIIIKFLACAFVLDQGKNVCISLITFGNDVYDLFVAGVVENTEEATALDSEAAKLFDQIQNGNIFTCVGIIGTLIIPAVTMLACLFVALTQLIGRLLELGIRIAFAPIGIADIFAHGVTGSPGIRYMKSLAGCACQGAALFLIIAGGTALMSGSGLTTLFGTGGLGTFFTTFVWAPQVLIGLAMIGVMKRVDSILSHAFA